MSNRRSALEAGQNAIRRFDQYSCMSRSGSMRSMSVRDQFACRPCSSAASSVPRCACADDRDLKLAGTDGSGLGLGANTHHEEPIEARRVSRCPEAPHAQRPGRAEVM